MVIRFSNVKTSFVGKSPPLVLASSQERPFYKDLFMLIENVPFSICLGCLLALLFLFVVLKFSFKKIFIYEYEVGLLYSKGRFRKRLGPGIYSVYSKNSKITILDQRKQNLLIPGQEILTADQIHLKISLVLTYQIENPELALHATQNYLQDLYTYAQTALRSLVSIQKSDELLANRNTLVEMLKPLIEQKASDIGLTISFVDIKDFILSGELKKVFAEVVRAQKEGLAALERARGESAALRCLANAAKLLENNPSLLQLRVLQSLSPTPGHPGNTLVWGVPTDGVVPISERKQAAEAPSIKKDSSL